MHSRPFMEKSYQPSVVYIATVCHVVVHQSSLQSIKSVSLQPGKLTQWVSTVLKCENRQIAYSHKLNAKGTGADSCNVQQ